MNIIFRLMVALLTFTTIILSKELITPIPDNIEYDKQKADLGKKLFFDTRLSADDTVSCANCHF